MRRPALLACVLGLLRLDLLATDPPAVRLEEDRIPPAVDLVDQDGRPFSLLRDRGGRPVLLTFIFTRCPGACPFVVEQARAAARDAANPKDLRSRPLVVAVSFDPEHDTPAVLRAYAKERQILRSEAVFLTGKPAAVEAVTKAYELSVVKDADGQIQHAFQTVVIDRAGRITARWLGYNVDRAALAADARRAGRPPAVPVKAPPPGEVKWVGALRDVMHAGDLRGKANLLAFRPMADLYAVGPLEELKGEVTVVSGVAYQARVDDGKCAVRESWDAKACFLVYARVPAWKAVSVDPPVRTVAELEERLPALAKAAGLDPGKPFPFRIRGEAESVAYHLVDKRDDTPHDPAEHDRIKVHLTLEGQRVQMIGFRSTAHTGVFIPKDRTTHVHVVTEDRRTSGHVDDFAMREMVLELPWR